jgi:23S rRNA pseudouridine1911/1915/1917 synthase
MLHTDLKILFEDNHLLAVNKPAGVIVQADKSGDVSLEDLVKRYLKLKYNKPGDAYLGISHRIDRPVSGVVLMCKTSKALERINEMFRERQVKKTYWAVVKNLPEQLSDTLIHWLIRDTEKNKSKVFNKEVNNSQRCELEYKHIASSSNYHLLEVNPLTGRHHQIRCQLAKIGCSIKGDLKYGAARSNEDGSIHLHARKLEFIHPVTKEKITIKARPPIDPVWYYFMESQGNR